MAKGQLLTMSSLEGSIGGLTFRNDKGGNVFSPKVTHKSIRSSKQSQRNSFLTSYACAWRVQTESRRKAWNRSRYGAKSGFKLFMYCHLNRTVTGMYSIVTVQPIPSFPVSVGLTASNNSAGNKSISISMSPTPATGFSLEIQATNPVSSGTMVCKESFFKIMTVAGTASTGTVFFTTQYTNTYGNQSESQGLKMFVRVRFIHKNSGYAGPWIRTSTIVT